MLNFNTQLFTFSWILIFGTLFSKFFTLNNFFFFHNILIIQSFTIKPQEIVHVCTIWNSRRNWNVENIFPPVYCVRILETHTDRDERCAYTWEEGWELIWNKSARGATVPPHSFTLSHIFFFLFLKQTLIVHRTVRLFLLYLFSW